MSVKENFKREARQSNYELLRILAILFIVSSHWGWAFIDVNFSGVPFINFTWHHVFRSFGQVGNVLFIMISGYFLCNGKFKISSVIRLVLEVIFYNIILFIAGSLILKYTNSDKVIVGQVYEIFIVFSKNWFLDVYFILYIFHPFINKLINSINKSGYRLLLVILIVLISLFPSLNVNFLSNNMVNNVLFFVFVYLIGAYIKRHKEDFLNTKLFIIGLIVALVFFICANAFSNEVEQRNNIALIFLCLCLFVLFGKLNFKSGFVNAVGSTSLGVYMLHENSVLRFFLWEDILLQDTLLYSSYFIPASLGAVLCVFCVAVMIDLFRQYILEKPFFKLLDSNSKIKLGLSKVNSLFDLGADVNIVKEENNGDNKPFYFLFILFIGYIIAYVLTKTISMKILNLSLIFLIYTFLVFIVFCIVKALKNHKKKKDLENI